MVVEARDPFEEQGVEGTLAERQPHSTALRGEEDVLPFLGRVSRSQWKREEGQLGRSESTATILCTIRYAQHSKDIHKPAELTGYAR